MTEKPEITLLLICFKRIKATAQGLLRKVVTPPRVASPRSWTERMTLIGLFACFGIVIIHPFDADVVRALSRSPDPPIVLLRAITDVGLSTWYLITAFIVMMVASLMNWRALKPNHRALLALSYSQAAFAFTAIAATGLLADLAKILVGRARPKFLDLYGPDYFRPLHVGYDFASFPSGHSTTLGAIAAILSLWFPRARFAITGLALVFALSRSAADSHYPSDVFAGFVVGFLLTILLARLLARRGAGFRFSGNALMPALRFKRTSSLHRCPARSQFSS
ncbi:phosphatase PAP2 family protein [Novosphingobium naphthalenivorans]|uniref:phosphatase PAP2 family protein n=1 Tax=Novosphingobium naphthalenivorans TaxID=273168 RepID=UPI000A000F06|nr:phosphatase PAP2 family protein [Novosphingobium naphthalenivorans]